MKVIKVIIALVVSFALVCSQGILMGAFACDQSFSKSSITKSVEKSNFTQELYDKALATSNQAAGPKVSAFLKEALQTDAASQAMGEYASQAIDSALYGKTFTEFTEQDLRQLANDSMDELSQTSGISIPEGQKQLVLQYINENGASIVSEINDSFPAIESTLPTGSHDIAAISQVQQLLGTPMRVLLGALCLIFMVILVILFWQSKLGFVWCAFVSFLCGAGFLLVGASSDVFNSYIQSTGEGTAFSLLLTGMFTRGFTTVGFAALVLGALLIALCLIGRKIFKVHAN